MAIACCNQKRCPSSPGSDQVITVGKMVLRVGEAGLASALIVLCGYCVSCFVWAPTWQAIGEGAYARVLISADIHLESYLGMIFMILASQGLRCFRPGEPARGWTHSSGPLFLWSCWRLQAPEVAVKEMRCGRGAGILPDASVERAMFEIKATLWVVMV